MREACAHTQCHLNFVNEFKLMITVVNFETLISLYVNHVFIEETKCKSDFRIVEQFYSKIRGLIFFFFRRLQVEIFFHYIGGALSNMLWNLYNLQYKLFITFFCNLQVLINISELDRRTAGTTHNCNWIYISLR